MTMPVRPTIAVIWCKRSNGGAAFSNDPGELYCLTYVASIKELSLKGTTHHNAGKV